MAAVGESGAACVAGSSAGRGMDCKRLSAACTFAALGRTPEFTAMHACHRSATPCGQSSGTLRAKGQVGWDTLLPRRAGSPPAPCAPGSSQLLFARTCGFSLEGLMYSGSAAARLQQAYRALQAVLRHHVPQATTLCEQLRGSMHFASMSGDWMWLCIST